MNPFEKLAYNELEELIPKTWSYTESVLIQNGVPTKAKVLGWIMTGEDTYITYTYFAKEENCYLLFAWMTPYDERHRAWGKHPAEWYDELQSKIEFDITYNPENPEEHFVLNPKFERMNKGQIFFAKH